MSNDPLSDPLAEMLAQLPPWQRDIVEKMRSMRGRRAYMESAKKWNGPGMLYSALVDFYESDKERLRIFCLNRERALRLVKSLEKQWTSMKFEAHAEVRSTPPVAVVIDDPLGKLPAEASFIEGYSETYWIDVTRRRPKYRREA